MWDCFTFFIFWTGCLEAREHANCCMNQKVGNFTYSLIIDDVERDFPEDCQTKCAYTRDGETGGPDYCFKPGDLLSSCVPKDSQVSCGNHVASSCDKCPERSGETWCNGQCVWKGDKCMEKTGEPSGARIGGKDSFLAVLGGEKDGINPPECPKKMPDDFSSCSVDRSITCSYGEECCCGKCSFSFGLNCDSGSWWMYHTEFCAFGCRQGIDNEPDVWDAPECPVDMPINNSTCSRPYGATCHYDEICCCGNCDFATHAQCVFGKWKIIMGDRRCHCTNAK